MSMLKYFFEIPKCREYDFENEDMGYLFEDLAILKSYEGYRKYLGKYPVVYLTLKNAKQNNWEETLINIKKEIANEYKRHRYLLESDFLSDAEKNMFKSIMNLEADTTHYTDVIQNLTNFLKRYFKEDCIVIIDEYDTPIQSGYIEGYFMEAIEFQKIFWLKDLRIIRHLSKVC